MTQSATKGPSNLRGLPGAQVAKVLERVNYEDDAIANREVAETTIGSVAILAFDEELHER